MCAGYELIGHANPGGKPLPKGPPKPGKAPPPDRVNNQEVESQTNRQRLADEAQAAYDKQEQPINWRERRPSKDDPAEIRLARLQSRGPQKGGPGRWEYIDDKRHQLKLNPDGTPAYGFDRAYYEDPENWYSKSDLEEFYGGGSGANDDGVNL